MLYWYNKDFPGNVLFDQSFQDVLHSAKIADFEYYPEYLESNRFPGESQEKILRDYLQQKYADRPVDVVVAVTDAAMDFLLKYRKELFPRAPLAFLGIKKPIPELLTAGPGITGILGASTHKQTVDLALSLHPDTQHLFFISGTPERDKRFETVARRELQDYEGKLKINYLTDLPLDQLIATTKTLPKHSIVLYGWQQSSNNQGEFLETWQTLDQFAPSTSSPIYGMGAINVGHGIVGGYVADSQTNGVAVGQIVVRILKGERPQDIPVTLAPTVVMFDSRQLQRWGIRETSLPAGSVVLFKEVTFWTRYKWTIITVLSLITFQSLLITYLLINRSQRRRADMERERLTALVEKEHRHLEEVISNVPGIVWETRFDSSGNLSNLFASNQIEKLLGYKLEEWESDPKFWFSLVPEEDRDETLRQLNEIFERGQDGVVQCRCRAKDGRVLVLEANLSVTFDENKVATGLRGVSLDITDRKQAEMSLHHALKELSELKEQLQKENLYLKDEIRREHNFEEIIGNSNELNYVLFKVEKVAPTDSVVLIQGETGTGKELIARAIHGSSKRKDRPLVKINCAALPATLIESELFGHEKGAFTGAESRVIGRFEVADGATLFLDEVSELPLELQSKLLRVLQEGEFERLGSSTTTKVDVRIIAATNRDLQTEVQNGLFREDLWYRLNVYPITVPPLRDRKGDIAPLANAFIKQFSKKLGRIITNIDPKAIAALQNSRWPGNVRELRNTIERAVINAQGPVLSLVDNLEMNQSLSSATDDKTLEQLEREIIIQRLEESNWKISGANGAAESLGLHPNTLRARMLKLHIHRESTTPAREIAARTHI